MDNLVSKITKINSAVNSFAWGPLMLLLLVGTGVFLTIKTRWLQVKHFRWILKNTIGKLFGKNKRSADKGVNLTPFQAVATALAGTVGTGNIAGVTGAIFAGGPGAVFWMWLAAFFGMVTKYSEIALSMKYRETDADGVHHGGPMYYISNGLGKNYKWLAILFCILGGIACFGIGNIAQTNEISNSLIDLFHLKPIVSAVIIAVFVGLVVLGGIKRIGAVAEYVVPFMSLFYIIAGILVIILRINQIPAVFGLIFKEAFSFKSIGGGIFGYTIMMAMKQGFARGVFSNEAGLGSAPIAHAASSETEPCKQAIWGVFEVFIDTIIICSITSLAVLLSGVCDVEGGLSAFASKGVAAATAFNTILPGNIGGTIIQISLVFFSFTTVLGWAYYGENCWRYLTNNNKVIITIYKIVFILVTLIGSTGNGTLMWDIADTLNGLMAIPNLIALLLLSKTVQTMTDDYFSKNDLKADKKTRK